MKVMEELVSIIMRNVCMYAWDTGALVFILLGQPLEFVFEFTVVTVIFSF